MLSSHTSILFHRSLLLSDDEEDTKRVVRSAKDKRLVWLLIRQHMEKTLVDWSLNFTFFNKIYRFEELTNIIKTIRNAMKIRDMAKCLEEFEQLCRAFLKSKNIVDKEGVPPFYIRILADLEDYLNQVSSLCVKLHVLKCLECNLTEILYHPYSSRIPTLFMLSRKKDLCFCITVL